MTDAFLANIEQRPLPQRRHRRPDVAARTVLTEQLEVLHHDFHIGRVIGRADYLRCAAELNARLAAIASDTNRPVTPGLPAGFDVRHTASAWPVLSTEQHRTILKTRLSHITVARAVRGQGFQPGRLTLHWVTGLV